MHTPPLSNGKPMIDERRAGELLSAYGSPLYVYDAATVRARYRELAENIAYPETRIHYACKANTNLHVLRLLQEEGAGVECVSPGEVTAALRAGFSIQDIVFTCSNISRSELAWLAEKEIVVNLDSLTQVRRWGELKPGSSISIRINQGIGAGHHEHVITGGPESKFGIDISQLDEALALAEKSGLRVTGIHQHIGSSILDPDIFLQAVDALLETAGRLKDLAFIDFGGGFGVPYRPEERRLDIKRLGRLLSERFEAFARTYGSRPVMRFEAGRYLVAEAGTLLVTVTDVKRTPDRTFVGTDSGFNHLIRPAMYDSYHHILNVTRPDAEIAKVTIAGNVCESGDVFAKERDLPLPEEDDVLAILTAGAYGFAMSSTYNSRPRPAEVLVEGTDVLLIKERAGFEDIL